MGSKLKTATYSHCSRWASGSSEAAKAGVTFHTAHDGRRAHSDAL